METKNLESALKLAQPCLLGVDFIPVLSHFCFTDGLLYAYDGVSAVIVSCETGLECALRGDTLLGLVGLAGKEISLKQAKDKVELISGASRIDLPCLAPKDFAFQLPEQETLTEFMLNEDFVKGLALCAATVGKDPRRAEFTGVTILLGKDVTFYSSDTTSITKFKPGVPAGKKNLTVIIPQSVCNQILATISALEATVTDVSVTITKEFITVQFDKTDPVVTIVGMLLAAKPADFEQAIKGCESNKPKFKIPEGFDKAVAKVVLITARELQKDCTLYTEKEVFWVKGQGALGKVEEEFETDHILLPKVTTACSSEHLTKMLADVTHLVVDEAVIKMEGEKLTYYVATRS